MSANRFAPFVIGGLTPFLLVAVTFLAAEAGEPGDHSASPKIGTWGVDLDGRDLSIRLEDDFFRYANGTWLNDFEIPEDLSSYGSFTKLFLESEEHVREIIEKTAASDAPAGTAAQKVGDLFADFVNLDAIEDAGLAPLDSHVKAIAALETHEDVARFLGHNDRRGGSAPFNWYIDQDEKDPTRYLVHFLQSGLGLPDRDYYLVEDNERFADARDAYRLYLWKMFTIAGADDPAASRDAVFALEERIAEVHWTRVDSRDAEKTYNLMTPESLAELAPDLPWDIYLEELGVASETEFVVAQPSAFAGMAEIFEDTPVDVWQQWLTYRLFRNNAPFLPKKVDDTHFEFRSALSGAEEQRERWKRGVQTINGTLGEAVGQLYVEWHFSPDSKKRVQDLVGNLMAAFADKIETLDWMSDETKEQARDKLAKFSVKIGYPDEWRDYSDLEVVPGDLLGNIMRARSFQTDYELDKLGGPVDRNERFMNPQTVNAYYNPNMNEIVFPAAILAPPFFDPWADDAVNYGAIGAVIGHEIGHGFDDQGRKSDGDGVLRDWWTEKDAERFKVKADVLVQQYNGYSPIEGMNVNGELTLGENIGDLGGVEIAYYAYKLSLDGKEPPVIDGFTADQRFFLGFAQIWRGKRREELMTQLLASDPHSPVEFRVNGTLRNVDAWYAAFDVTEDDAMYLPPEERVHIW
jgi:endothelin-converting enzyme/putative endopeptidase